MKHIQFFTLLYVLFLFFDAETCQDSTQLQGQCTSCNDNEQVLVQGNCYKKITGCSQYVAGPKCSKCQNGYILANQNCIRQAILLNNTDLSPAELVPDNASELTPSQIRQNLILSSGLQIKLADEYFRRQNPEFSIQKVDLILGKIGKYIVIRYSAENISYIVWTFINQQKQVIQQKVQQFIGIYDDPVSVYNLVRNLDEVQSLDLFSITQSENLEYFIDFIQESNPKEITRISILKEDISIITPSNLREKVQIENILINTQMKPQSVLSPNLQSQSSISIPNSIITSSQNHAQCQQTAPQYTILYQNNPNPYENQLYQQVRSAIKSYRQDWLLSNPILVLRATQDIKAYVDDFRFLYEVFIVKDGDKLKAVDAQPLVESTGRSILNTQQFLYPSLILPKGILSTSSLIDLMKQIALASEQSLPEYIENPEVIIASIIDVRNYRLMIKTQKSPKDIENQYYIQYDAIVSDSGVVSFYGTKRVYKKFIKIPNCGKYSVFGDCLDCNQQQISYQGQCFNKIENCQIQALGLCLYCENKFQIFDNKCKPKCNYK